MAKRERETHTESNSMIVMMIIDQGVGFYCASKGESVDDFIDHLLDDNVIAW